ncbi:MAG: thiosulfate oxidation carrier complex protein SoxZ [Gammaproteobacteria bacterium]|nr:thiosulfate oxidation carrier complex protein SoxZ [Gammaproteobacteria bacterium]
MANISFRLKAENKGDFYEVKALFKHPMESGTRKNKATGEVYPADFINEITAKVNGTPAMVAEWSGAVSQNPFLAFRVTGKAGDKVEVSCTSNKGDTGTKTVNLA